ncbi:hypothetical protein ACFLQV_00460 [Calditrichota bacterium]
MKRFAYSVMIILMSIIPLYGQYIYEEYNHPELEWKFIESDHFFVHFHQGSERSARTVLTIAEEVYEPITNLYDYEPEGKIHWIIQDFDDYANGASYFYDQKIILWATALDFEFRGQHHWLYDVITHEFTHMIQLGAARKAPRWMPGVYFQYFGYEPEKRPDVLYGYPNRIVSYPVAGTVMPMWFAEGTAQYMVKDIGNDWWDSHRDMMLRSPVLAGELMSWNEMGVFGKTSLGSERVYNHGYALTTYIANRWGEDVLSKLTEAMKNPFRVSFDSACKKVLGISGKRLHKEWKDHLTADYMSRTESIRANPQSGEPISDGGYANLYPALSSDGSKIAFVSNEGADYFSLSKLKIFDIIQDSLTDVDLLTGSTVDWSPNGKYILYSSKDKADYTGSKYDDLFLWNIEAKESIRLTWQARLASPAFSPDGNRIVAIHNSDGTHNLAIVDLPDSIEDKDIHDQVTWRKITHFDDGQQIFKPRFTPDGEGIICSKANLGPRDIYTFSIEDGSWTPILNALWVDERDPFLSKDGNTIYWADDHTGIFNIYSRNLTTLEEYALTNVTGGAFMPVVTNAGDLIYSEFNEDGYGMRLLKNPDTVDHLNMTYMSPDERIFTELDMPHQYTETSEYYDTPFSSLFVLPRLYLDYGEVKPGFYAYTNDILERLGLFGGAAFAFNGDRDLYLNLTYRMFFPTLFIDVYNIVRERDDEFDDTFVIIDKEGEGANAKPIYDKYSANYQFNLSEYNIGARHMLMEGVMPSLTFRYSSYKSVFTFEDQRPIDYTYFRGRALILRTDIDRISPTVARDIHPHSGFKGWFEYGLENNRFLVDFTVDAEKGTPLEVYKPYNYQRVETDFDYYHELFNGLVFNPRLMAGVIADSVDSFFHLYAGGLPGMRGYSFYSMGGTRKAVFRTTLRFPLFSNINSKFGPIYFDRMSGAVFAEVGDAWNNTIDLDKIKKDVGAELRLKLFSWYGYPTDIQFAGAYGLDRFSITDEDGSTEYGREMRWYLSILFDFL